MCGFFFSRLLPVFMLVSNFFLPSVINFPKTQQKNMQMKLMCENLNVM